MEYTFRIKLINRFRPTGIHGYKRNHAAKLPLRLRSSKADDLNVYDKKVECDRDDLFQLWGQELLRINSESENMEIKQCVDYGDRLIGFIQVLNEHSFERAICDK